jgi:hypothetical protein
MLTLKLIICQLIFQQNIGDHKKNKILGSKGIIIIGFVW